MCIRDRQKAAQERADALLREQEESRRRLEEARAKEEQERAIASAIETSRQLQIAPPSRPAEIKGQSAKMVVTYEVLDLRALLMHYPDCVKLEEKAQVIKNHISSGRFTVTNPPPGLRIYEEMEVRTTAPKRASKGFALEV